MQAVSGVIPESEAYPGSRAERFAEGRRFLDPRFALRAPEDDEEEGKARPGTKGMEGALDDEAQDFDQG